MSDPIPFTLRVLYAMTDALKEITPANGYLHDLSDFDPGDGSPLARVYRGRAWYGDSDPIPMLSILEAADFDDEVAPPPLVTASGEYDFDLIVQGFVDDDPLNPTDPAYRLAADVTKRLAIEVKRVAPGTRGQPDPFGLGVNGSNRVTGLSFSRPKVRPADDVSSKAYFWARVTPRLYLNPFEPYA